MTKKFDSDSLHLLPLWIRLANLGFNERGGGVFDLLRLARRENREGLYCDSRDDEGISVHRR